MRSNLKGGCQIRSWKVFRRNLKVLSMKLEAGICGEPGSEFSHDRIGKEVVSFSEQQQAALPHVNLGSK